MSSLHVPPILQPLSFPLSGSRLIEASAGTGKTFTIAALYLRLVLGHGADNAFTRALTPPEILVVTFTDAATKELRDRIRTRLAAAAEYFLADPAHVSSSEAGLDLLHDLRADYSPGQWPGCARKLQLAAEWMDEAAVSTIHSWCNRMLREHAFDSDSLFTQTLETDQTELLAEVVRDYWRSFFYPLGADSVGTVLDWWKTPDELLKTVRELLAHRDALGLAIEPAAALQQAGEAASRELASLKANWANWADELQKLLDAAVQAKQVNGNKLRANYYTPWLNGLRAWAASNEAGLPLEERSAGWTRLTPEGLREAWKVGRPPDHPALHAMVDLCTRLKQLPTAHDDVLRHATGWVADRFAVEQERRAQMGFNELVTRLDQALHGANGPRLVELIRQKFPVALIDEFQDTDPLQYRIFDAIYQVASSAPATALILIGDPKQAIYAFRGADIYTYLSARRDTGGRHYTLGTNFRSTGMMVAAANHCFQQAEQRDSGQGAFLFREANDNPLPFLEVAARGRVERWHDEGSDEAVLTCWHIDQVQELSKNEYVQQMALTCASEVVRLLQRGQQGRAGFAVDGQPLCGVKPGDIAVLVNTGNEATAVRQALTARGVRSVYLSDKESVFQSASADELQRWLAACAEPDDDRLLRAALGTATLGLGWGELDQLNHDELRWEARVLQFRAYRQCWRSQGVLPMLRRLLGDFEVPRRLLGRGDERTLTDVLHLAELLQQASAVLDGEHALIRHLAEQQQDEGTDSDVRKLRLESDADLVKVVTVHKAKGLEYPLVFLPFACSFRASSAEDLPLKWHDEHGRLHVALTADAAAVARADRDRLGEDLRKLYVALTRARFATWVGIAPLKNLERSALGYLLNGGQAIAPGTLGTVLKNFRGECMALQVVPAPLPSGARFEPLQIGAGLGPERRLHRARREPWWIASYSALRPTMDSSLDERRAVASHPSADSAVADTFAEGLGESVMGSAAARGNAAGTLHDFARGASPGSFLHGLLEWAGRQGFDRVRADPAAAADLVARRCNLRGWGHWIGSLAAWLPKWLDTPLRMLDATPVCLADLRGYQVEMEFWFATKQVDSTALDALVCRYTLEGAPRQALQPNQINGMLKGFIDLVFEHEGRYYVADYKSNWLGPRDEDYSLQGMRSAVLQHRFDLQYVLYLFALHRLLRSRLPDYDYDRHVGGAIYLFLRGHEAASQGLHAERPPRQLIDALDALFSAHQPSAETVA